MDPLDLALFAVRIVVGGLVVGHGLGNLFGAWGGFGLDGTGEILERLGYHPGRVYAGLAGVVEVVGGGLLMLGLLTPVAGAAIVGIMFNTMRTAHAGKGPWYFNGGWEYNLTLLTVGAALSFSGPGRISVDRLIDAEYAGWRWGTAAILAGLAAGFASLLVRRPQAGRVGGPTEAR